MWGCIFRRPRRREALSFLGAAAALTTPLMLRFDHRAGAMALFSVTIVTGMLATAGAGGAPGPRAATTRPATARSRHPVTAGQPLVVLRGDHVVGAAADGHARRIGWVAGRRPLTHVRTVLPVLGRAKGARGGAWVHVRLPGRPNGHAGWISADRTRAKSTTWRIGI